jgi:DnaJ-class molecular chaperone
MYGKGNSGMSFNGQSAADVMEEIFRGMGGMGIGAQPIMYEIRLSLEDYFLGKDLQVDLPDRSQFTVQVTPGMRGGQDLLLRGAGPKDRRGVPRDIIFRLKELEHPIFKRRNADLLMSMKITLKDALCGFIVPIKHIDGKTFWIKSKSNEIVSFGEVYMIPGLGMPVQNQKGVRGRLFIKIDIIMPQNLDLDPESQKAFQDILAKVCGIKPGKVNHPASDEQSVTMSKSSLQSFGAFGTNTQDESEDSEDKFSNPFSQFFFR